MTDGEKFAKSILMAIDKSHNTDEIERLIEYYEHIPDHEKYNPARNIDLLTILKHIKRALEPRYQVKED